MVRNFPPEGPCIFWAPEKHQKSCALISKIQRFNGGSYGPGISDPVDTKYVFFNLSITKSKMGMRQRWPCSCLPLSLLQWTYLSGRRSHRDSIHQVTKTSQALLNMLTNHTSCMTQLCVIDSPVVHSLFLILVVNGEYHIFTMFCQGLNDME